MKLPETKSPKIQTTNNVIDESFNLISKYEWFHATPYWDVVRYSIWYWQPAAWRTNITKEQAKEFVIHRIKEIRNRYKLDQYPDHIEVWLISFAYNLWKMPDNYKWYLDNQHYTALWNLMKKYVYAKWEYLEWLNKRRIEESNVVVNWFNI